MAGHAGVWRMGFTTLGVLVGMGVAAAQPAVAQGRGSMLVGPQAMAAALERDNAVLFHIGQDDTYAEEHIAGAHYLDPWELLDPASRGHNEGGLSTELPSADQLEAVLESYGVSDDSELFVYWADEWFTPTMRVLYTLDWGGLGDRVHLLDGGLPAWKEAGFPVTGEGTQAPTRGSLTLRVRPALVVDADWVQTHGGDDGIALVDARHEAAYDGVEADQGLPGHIAGAQNLSPFSLVDDDARFVGPAQLEEILATAGVREGDTVVAYCHIGQYATAVLFAARLTGHPVKLYDGSWQDWAQRGLPTEGGQG